MTGSAESVEALQGARQFLLNVFGKTGRMYAVIDSARNAGLARDSWFKYGFETWSLFGDTADGSMAAVAPRLVAIQPGNKGREFLNAWADHLWTNSGILFTSTADPGTVWNHLSQLFIAADSNGRLMYFRFYDPRILRALMPTLDASQIPEVFGPIREYLVEDGQPGTITRWTADGKKATGETVP